MNCVQCLCGLLQIVVGFAARNFPFNQGWTGAFDVTDATRTHIAFVSSSPVFVTASAVFRGPLHHFAPQDFFTNKSHSIALTEYVDRVRWRPARSPIPTRSQLSEGPLRNRTPAPATKHGPPPFARVPNLTYIFGVDPCYSFLVAPSFKGANHGMDRTEARRDRPQLRNQLVRQRRALIEIQLPWLPLSVSKPAAAASWSGCFCVWLL